VKTTRFPILSYLANRNLGTDGVLAKTADAHEMMNFLGATSEAAAPIWHHSLPLTNSIKGKQFEEMSEYQIL
jgi:hypothetical protein